MTARRSKWLENCSPDDRVSVVAARAIADRIDGALEFLPLAAHHADDDVEYVHEARVWIRRSLSALKLFKPILPAHELDGLRLPLRAVRSATGDARDCDVMVERFRLQLGTANNPDARGQELLLSGLEDQRRAAQRAIVGAFTDVGDGSVVMAATERLVAALDKADGGGRFGKWARHRLKRFARAFADAAPNHGCDIEALHAFRIRTKRLRYAMELTITALPRDFADEYYAALADIQDHLGALNDHAVARTYLSRWIYTAGETALRAALLEQLDREVAALDQAEADFRAWWSPKYGERLVHDFRRLLKDKHRQAA